jgi:hypothetical protein
LGDGATAGSDTALIVGSTSFGHYAFLRQSRITLFNDGV